MKTLPTTFTSKGFDHQQVERIGNIALYARSREGGGQEHFEVIRIKSHNGFKIPGTDDLAPPAEMYPTAEQWGTNGWTMNDKEKALEKFRELTKSVDAKPEP